MRRADMRRPGAQRGQSATEFIIALPVIILLVFGTIQLGLLYQGRATLNHATLQAARAGAVNNGNVGAMRNALARGLAPLFASDASFAGYNKAWARAQEETAAASLMTSIEVLSPTPAAFSDFGRPREDGKSGMELPNDTLAYRSTADGSASKLSIQDANLLHVRVTYCYRLIVPVIDRMLHFMLNGAAPDTADVGTSNPFGIGSAAVAAPCTNPLLPGRRIHIRSEAIVRMQSPFYKANLSGSGTTPPGGGATPPGGGTTPPGGGTTPPVEPPVEPEDPGTPLDPGGQCTGADCGFCPIPPIWGGAATPAITPPGAAPTPAPVEGLAPARAAAQGR